MSITEHGLPDWGDRRKRTIYALSDMAELAARLGSIVTFDRRGDVVFMTDFENGLGLFHEVSTATDGVVSISNYRAKSGVMSCLINSGTDTSKYKGVKADLAINMALVNGLEFSIACDSEVEILQFWMVNYTGAKVTYAAIKHDIESQNFQYMDETLTWQAIATDQKIWSSDKIFNTYKFVVDFENGTYNRLLVNGLNFDLSDFDMRSTGSLIDTKFEIWIYIESKGDYNALAYLDDVIVTQNEPI